MRLDGLELIYGLDSSDHLYESEPSIGRPYWPETDPFHWIPEARDGDTDAMIHAGNAFFREKQYDRAWHWFEQAQAQGDARAAERLELLSRAVARNQ
jgi:TPR repeat protein